MVGKRIMCAAISGSLLMAGFGCESLPGGKQEQGTVIGGLGGAAAGALIGGSDNRLLGALVGGALGAGGGWLIGTQLEKGDKDDAIRANERAERNPATAEQARRARTADVNEDGYVTLDEVVAMDQAGLSDDEIVRRLEATDMYFDLSTQQKEYLRNNGVSARVANAMNEVNPEIRREAEARLAAGTLGTDSVGERR